MKSQECPNVPHHDLRAHRGPDPVDVMISRSCNIARSTAELRHMLRALCAVW